MCFCVYDAPIKNDVWWTSTQTDGSTPIVIRKLIVNLVQVRLLFIIMLFAIGLAIDKHTVVII